MTPLKAHIKIDYLGLLLVSILCFFAPQSFGKNKKEKEKEKDKEKLTEKLTKDDLDNRFRDEEIRVIRPKFFTKRKRFELGAGGLAVMNEAFVYSVLFGGTLGYHINELFAFDVEGFFGNSADKESKRVLFDEFEITTQIVRIQSVMSANLLMTPMYGKWQLVDGTMVYFDTVLSAGFGMTGVNWAFSDFCEVTDNKKISIPADTSKNYPTFLLGLGQRFFMSKETAIQWNIKAQFLSYDNVDSSCSPEGEESEKKVHPNVTFSFGVSRFL